MRTLIFTTIMLLFSPLWAAGVKNTIKRLASAPGAANASWSLSVKAVSGKRIAEHNPALNLVPASIMKVMVTAAALEKFGPGQTFTTSLFLEGELSRGVLNGNIRIVGGGDPSLGSELIKNARPFREVLADWAGAVRKAGIKSVKGAVIGDGSAFDSVQPGSWAWEDIGNYYAAQPSALIANDGYYRLFFRPSEKVGEKAEVLRTEPEVKGLKFENYMRTGPEGSGDNGYIYAFPGQSRAVLRGTIPQGKPEFSIKGALPDPALFVAQSFSSVLSASGVPVSGTEIAFRAPPPRKLVAETISRPLREVVRVTNKRSFNLYAEMLLRHLGGGSPSAGAEAVRDFISKSGADVSELKLADGCGLSRGNRVKAENFTDLLRALHDRKYFRDFYDSLVFPGDPDASGHARRIGVGTPLEKNLRLKSGSLNGVRAYTGYLRTKKGRELAFTSIVNNYSFPASRADRMHEELFLALYNSY